MNGTGGDPDPWSYLARRLGAHMKPPDDAFFFDGDAVCAMRTSTYLTRTDNEEFLHPDYPTFSCTDCHDEAVIFTQLHDFEAHYAATHRHECGECGAVLPSEHLLHIHLVERHDSFFAVACQRSAKYECYLPTCGMFFWDAERRRDHCLKEHDFQQELFSKFEDVLGGGASVVASSGHPAGPRDQGEAKPESVVPQKESVSVDTPSSSSLLTPRQRVIRRPKSALMASPSTSPSKIPVAAGSPLVEAKSPKSNARKRFSLATIINDKDGPSLSTKLDSRARSVARTDLGKSCQDISDPVTDHNGSHIEVSAPANRVPLSLARMGERLTLSQSRTSVITRDLLSLSPSCDIAAPSSTEIRSNAASAVRPDHQQQSNVSAHCDNSASTSPTKKSRIPVFKRSQSLKVPKHISFGRDVEPAFSTANLSTHWHSRRRDGNGAVSMDFDLESNRFEQGILDALNDCTF